MKTPARILQLAASALVAALSFFRAANASAQSGTWTNHVVGNASGSWTNAVNWTNGVIATGTDNTADFSTLDLTADSTVTLDGVRTIGNLILGDAVAGNNLNINTGSAGPLTLSVSAGQPTINTVNGSNNIGAVLLNTVQPSGITKSGNGTLRLGAANLMTNVINNLNAGTLQLGNNTALGAVTAGVVGSNNVANGATLHVLAGVQAANQRIFLVGAGVGGTNGAVRGDAGTAASQQNTRLSFALSTVANPAFVLTGDATIRVDGNTNQAGFLVGAITNNAAGLNYTLTKTGASELRVDPGVNIAVSNIVIAEGIFGFSGSGNVSGAQVVTVNGGTVAGGRRNTSFNSSSSTLVLNGTLELCYNPGAFGDAVGFDQRIGVLQGSGLVRNSIQNNYTTFRVQSATSNSLFSGTFATPAPTNGPIVMRKSGAGTSLRLAGSSSYRGTNFVEAGSLIIDGAMNPVGGYIVNSGAALSGAGTISVPITVTVGGTLVAGSPAGTLTVSNITGAGDVIVSNANLTVNGQLNSSGGGGVLASLYLSNSVTTINLQGGTESSIYSSAVNVDGTNNTLNVLIANPAIGQFSLIGSVSSIGGLNGFAGLKLQSPAGVGSYLSNNTGNASIDIVITNIPALIWRGTPSGDWLIGGSLNWLNGATPSAYTETAGAGPFVIFDDTAAGTASVNLTTNVNPKGITVDATAKTYSITGSGAVIGTNNWVKSGTSTFTVANSGPNSFSGGVTITAGAISLGNGGTAGDLGTASIINNSSLVFNRSDNVTFANSITGTGGLVKQAAGTTTLAGVGNVSSPVTLNAGTLSLAPAGNITVSGDLTGAGGFGVSGAGTVDVTSGTISYTGGTTITNGTLKFSSVFPPSGTITDNGTLALAVGGTLANNISGSGNLSVLNGIAVTLGGTNSYTGLTSVKGQLDATSSFAWPSNSALKLGDLIGGTDIGVMNFSGNNPALGGLSAGANNLTPSTLNMLSAGQTVTVNGNWIVGSAAPNTAIVGFNVTGDNFSVITNGGVIQLGLGNTGSGVNPDNVTVDLTGLTNFTVDLGTNGNFNMGTLDGNPGPPAGATVTTILKLAATNNITSGTLTIGAGGRQLIPELRLSAGVNNLNVDNFNIGSGGRDGGKVVFDTGTGSLKVRGVAGGSTAANYNQLVNPTTGTSGGITTDVDLTGGTNDLNFGTFIIGDNPARVGAWTNTFTFGAGVLNATSVSLSKGANNNANLHETIMSINGGTATLGPVSLTASSGTGTLNINGGTVNVDGISSTGTGAATLNLSGTTLNITHTNLGNPAAALVVADNFSATGPVALGLIGTNLTVGQFPLISYTGAIGGGGFAGLTSLALPAGYSGSLSNNTANLSVDVVITSAPVLVNPNPTNIVFTASGGNLNLSWPSDHTGWSLQVQTNSRAVGLTVPTNTWFTVPGSTGTNAMSFTINPTNPTVFFRMLLHIP